jgi:cytochrome c peroxidase
VPRPFVLLAVLVACSQHDSPAEPDELTADERAALATLSPLGPVPPDRTNAVADDPRAVRLGQMLFFDEDLSGSRAISCQTCHDGPALDDQRAPNHVSIGAGIGIRNTPPVLNSAFYAWANWGGRFDSQWSLVLGAIENPAVMNGSRLEVARTVVAEYRAEHDALFPPIDPAFDPALDPATVDRVFANVGKAIAAYMRTLVARDAPFDRFAAGDPTAISPAARRGFRLFLQHCERCHRGPHFQDDAFHAIGVAQFGAHVPATDLGRFTDVAPLLASPFNTAGPHSDGPSRLAGLAQDPAQRGQFRTPTLRNVAVTAPYMHAGQLATLEAVVAFYNAGGGVVDGVGKSAEMKRLGLTDEEQADLVAFLETLTDTALPPERLEDTSR